MTNTRLGFKKDIKLDWINFVLNLTLQGLNDREIRKEFNDYMSHQQSAHGKPYSKNIIGFMLPMVSVWFKKDSQCPDFRKALIEEARNIPSSQWLPLHWALFSVEYPLWYAVANQTGKLFALQTTIKPSQIYARIKDTFGDTETVMRNSQFATSTLSLWGAVIKKDEKNGQFEKAPSITISDKQYALLCEGVLRATESSLSDTALYQEKSIFPFSFNPLSLTEISHYCNGRLEIKQQGPGRILISARSGN